MYQPDFAVVECSSATLGGASVKFSMLVGSGEGMEMGAIVGVANGPFGVGVGVGVSDKISGAELSCDVPVEPEQLINTAEQHKTKNNFKKILYIEGRNIYFLISIQHTCLFFSWIFFTFKQRDTASKSWLVAASRFY